MTLPVDDIKVQPVPFERLLQFAKEELVSRKETLTSDVSRYSTMITMFEEDLVVAKKRYDFLSKELENVTTVLRILNDDLVRVACPDCKGSGAKAVDVQSARLTGSAFELGGSPTRSPTEIDPRYRCERCGGQRWVVMERYRG